MTAALLLHRSGGAPLSTSFWRAAFGKDDPFAREREIAWEGPDAMIAGRVGFIGMHLLAGGVRFASPDGRVLSASAGDALFVPQGAPIGWESSERVAKFYVVQDVRA